MKKTMSEFAKFVYPSTLCAVLLTEMVCASPRARDLGVPFEGIPGPLNAITDVAGVDVGHITLIEGEGMLEVGKGPVRTGVTAVLPRGRESAAIPVFGGWFTLNAAGEMTGVTWLQERGYFTGPVMITNTHSVGVVRDAVIDWQVKNGGRDAWYAPVVAETYDGRLNDLNGFHVTAEHAKQAIDSAKGGAVEEGSVGGGTGMICSRFKAGIGTASRIVETNSDQYTVGVLVQCNYGKRHNLRIAGLPVGEELKDRYLPDEGNKKAVHVARDGSIIVVVATDAPLMSHQLTRLAKRPALGLGRLGSISENGSGDIFLAFSTANKDHFISSEKIRDAGFLANYLLTPLFEAVVQATEEAVVNSMVAAETMTGINGATYYGLPHKELIRILKKHNKLKK